MFSFLGIIIFLTSSCPLVLGTQHAQKVHSLLGPFAAGNAYLPYWDLTGSSEMKSDVIRLTSDEPGKRGAIWNNLVNEIRDWEFQVSFQIHGKGVNLSGDGMAIWYAREPLHLGPVFGSKDYFSGLGVFLDTYKSHDNEHTYPYISVMVNNGTLHYNAAQDGMYASIGGCHGRVRNLNFPIKIAVSYIRSVLMVFLDMEGFGQWKQCFKSHGIHLPTGYYFGVSASTGELSDNHDVISITVLDLDPLDVVEKEDRSGIMPEAEYFELPKEYRGETQEEKESDGHQNGASQQISLLKLFFYTVGTATILVVVIMLCKKYHEQRKIRIEKRLY